MLTNIVAKTSCDYAHVKLKLRKRSLVVTHNILINCFNQDLKGKGNKIFIGKLSRTIYSYLQKLTTINNIAVLTGSQLRIARIQKHSTWIIAVVETYTQFFILLPQ